MIAFVFILIALIILTLGFQYFAVERLRYTIIATGKFRDLRHKGVIYLSDNINSENLTHLQRVRNLIEATDVTIREFEHVPGLRMHSVKKIISSIIISTQKIDRISLSESELKDNETMHAFILEYFEALKYALKAVPIIRAKFVITLIRLIGLILVSIGVKKIKDYLSQLNKLWQAEEHVYNSNHCPMP